MAWKNSFVTEHTEFTAIPQDTTYNPTDNLMKNAVNPAKFDIESQLDRAVELDTLDAILPFDRREKLAEILTDDDVATLKHLAKEGLGANSLRALTSDLAYLESWALAATGAPLPWPAPEALLVKFIAHHLWDAIERDANPDHGMPAQVSDQLKSVGLLKSTGPHSPATVRRRLSSWSTLTQWRGLTGVFNAPSLRSAIKLAVRATPRHRVRKSKTAVTADVLHAILKPLNLTRLVDVRDRALLLLAFASGGRRRSEIANLRLEDLVSETPVLTDPRDPLSAKLACLTIHLGRTKTASADEGDSVVLIGRPVDALQDWISRTALTAGPLFRSIDQWGNVRSKALSPQSINLILKSRIKAAGLDPTAYSAHGLRSGYLTEAANRGISLPEAMAQSRHKSAAQAASYYNNAERKMGKAARLMA
jgi:integrase